MCTKLGFSGSIQKQGPRIVPRTIAFTLTTIYVSAPRSPAWEASSFSASTGFGVSGAATKSNLAFAPSH